MTALFELNSYPLKIYRLNTPVEILPVIFGSSPFCSVIFCSSAYAPLREIQNNITTVVILILKSFKGNPLFSQIFFLMSFIIHLKSCQS